MQNTVLALVLQKFSFISDIIIVLSMKINALSHDHIILLKTLASFLSILDGEEQKGKP